MPEEGNEEQKEEDNEIPQCEYAFVPFKIPVIKEKLMKLVLEGTMKKDEFFIKGKDEKFPLAPKMIEGKYVSPIEREILKLKAKVDKINYVIEKKPMILYHVNAKIRYHDQLDKGLFDLTINPNYIREQQIPKIKIN